MLLRILVRKLTIVGKTLKSNIFIIKYEQGEIEERGRIPRWKKEYGSNCLKAKWKFSNIFLS